VYIELNLLTWRWYS